jgi:hypothetical protein
MQTKSVIFGRKFGLRMSYANDVCVTGKITSYKGIPETIASEPSQIQNQA